MAAQCFHFKARSEIEDPHNVIAGQEDKRRFGGFGHSEADRPSPAVLDDPEVNLRRDENKRLVKTCPTRTMVFRPVWAFQARKRRSEP